MAAPTIGSAAYSLAWRARRQVLSERCAQENDNCDMLQLQSSHCNTGAKYSEKILIILSKQDKSTFPVTLAKT